jgi:putative porin
MRIVSKPVGCALMATALVLSWFLVTPAQAATQADLERKIQMLEQSLQELKGDLKQVQSAQAKQEQTVAVAASNAAKSSLPGWVDRMTFYGDTRFRYEHTSFDELNGKSKTGKDRFRIRMRFGVRSQIHPDVELGLRMATGTDDDPTSTNQTMGNYFGEFSKWGIDRAYIKWTPSAIPGKGLGFEFGKVPQPFLTTKTIWDGDVVPEGAFLKYTANKGGAWQPFVTVAYMTVNQSGEWSNNVYAPAAQLGVRGKTGAFRFRGGLGYTSWGKLGDAGDLPPHLHGNPTYTDSAGETRMSEFRVWDVYARAGYKFNKKGSVDVWGHYLNNANASGPYKDKDVGWGTGASVKYDKASFGVWYKNLQANSSPGFIADSDSGFVNRKGWVLFAGYKMWKYGKVKLSYFNTEPEDSSVPGASNGSQTFFADFVFKF